MAVTVYQSTDASAPTLNNAAGSLCTVLDACLVNGYGAKASVGWTIPFTGTNKRMYRAPTGLLKAYLRVQDDAPRTAPFNNANEARITMSEGATTVDTQTGKFPNSTNGIILQKASTSSGRPWVVIADDRTVYMFVKSGDYGDGWAAFAAGEYFSLKTDNYNALLIGNNTETLAATPIQSTNNENLHKLAGITTNLAGHFFPRQFTEIGPSTANVGFGKHGNAAHSAATLTGLAAYPNPQDSAILLSQVWIHESMGGLANVRGRMRGFWHLLHPPASFRHGDTFNGTGALAGKSFMLIGPTPDSLGYFVMETSDTWEKN